MLRFNNGFISFYTDDNRLIVLRPEAITGCNPAGGRFALMHGIVWVGSRAHNVSIATLEQLSEFLMSGKLPEESNSVDGI